MLTCNTTLTCTQVSEVINYTFFSSITTPTLTTQTEAQIHIQQKTAN